MAEDELAPPPASALKTAEQVRRLLSQVLKLAEREDAFPGLAAAQSRVAARARANEMETVRHETVRAPARLPAENEPKRRGFG